jgi:hypothetical protein
MSIADNLQRVRERIARAAESAGRKPDEISLVGVTKYVDSNAAAELIAAGCTNLGESRPQELWKKSAHLQLTTNVNSHSHDGLVASATRYPIENPAIHWHLIGHLQRNKVARTLPLVTLIHSVDSGRLLATINESTALLPRPRGEGRGEGALANQINVLLEVNTSGESAKHGLAPDEVEPLLASAPQHDHVHIRGLMTMAAIEGNEATAARNFASLRRLRDRLISNMPTNVKLDELSMGMSGDFEIAIREGATIVRIGSLLWE